MSRSAASTHHGLSFLPQLFEQGAAGSAPGFTRRDFLLLVAILLPPAAIPLYLNYTIYRGGFWHQHHVHAVLEGFCALMSLVVFYVMHQEYVRSGANRLRMMAYGFLALGVLDLFHATSAPGGNLFVWFRATAAFAGSIFLAASVLPFAQQRARFRIVARTAWTETAVVAACLVAFGFGSYALEGLIPRFRFEYEFSPIAFLLNGSAAVLYSLVGTAFLRLFRNNREPVLFLLAITMLLIAESQMLFFFSKLWDFTWWAWHCIRVTVFVCIVAGLAYEFIASVRDLEASQASLVEKETLASLGEMAAAVAHEIRNPIATISSSIGLLRDARVSDGEARELLDILEREVHRLNHIVSDTLAFAHRPFEPPRTVAIEPLVSETLRGLAGAHPGVLVRSLFDPDLPPLNGNPHQLQRVVWNLVDNAVAAMRGGGTLTVHGSRVDGWVVLSIEDTGCGIPEQMRGNLFKPFCSTKANGTGLGLTIVQRIVSDHGGTICVEAGSSNGTRVIVRLPAAAGGASRRAVA